MITIVKRGVSPSEILYTATCRCGTVVTYHMPDTQHMQGDRPGEIGTNYLPCPVCRSHIRHAGAIAGGGR